MHIATRSTDRPGAGHPADVVIEARHVSRNFGSKQALRDVSLEVRRGEIHALLGPNGAGKTTLLRILSGLVDPAGGAIRLLDVSTEGITARSTRKLFAVILSGDRTFYHRLSGLENLVFFGRLQGLTRRQAIRRARDSLAAVGLADSGRMRVGTYSHGMQQRLSIARALLTEPPILFVDEATDGLDPEGATRVRQLVAAAARRGAAVIWTTQRVDEIRSFADRVTLLHQGEVRFSGSVPQLMATSLARGYLLQLRNGPGGAGAILPAAQSALGALGTLTLRDDGDHEHFLMSLPDQVVLGDALACLTASGIQVLACTEEQSLIELAFLQLIEGSQ